MSILNPFRSIRACMSFADNLSNILKSDHATKIKPIKLCHAIAKALLGTDSSWNSLQPKIESAQELRLKNSDITPSGYNTAIVGDVGKSNMIQGIVLNASIPAPSKILILDVGRSYELLSTLVPDSQFHVAESSQLKLPTIDKKINVIELEELKPKGMPEYLDKLKKNILKKLDPVVDIFIDESWRYPQSFLRWLLEDCPNNVTMTFFTIEEMNKLTSGLINGRTIHINEERHPRTT